MEKKIKSIKTYITSEILGLHFEDIEDKRYLNTYREYDENKNLILEKDFSILGEIETYVTNEYDNENRLTKTYILDQDESVLETHIFEYEDDGKLMLETTFYGGTEDDEDAFYDTTKLTYENDLLVSKECVDDDGEPSSKKMYQFSDGLLINEQIYGEEDNLEIELQYEYDENNNLTNELRIDHIENVKNYISNTYNSDDLLESSTVLNNYKQIVSRHRFEYDSKLRNNIIIEERPDSYVKREIDFDDLSRPLKESFFNSENELMQFKIFDYDEGRITSIKQFVFSPESEAANEEGFLLNGMTVYEYEFY